MKRTDIYIQLKDILARLKPYEAEVALNYLQAFDRKKEGQRASKSIRVLEALLENPGMSYDAVKGIVSPGLDKYSFNKFLLRLRNKIFDSLSLDLNIQRKESYSPWFRARLECTKRWVLIMNLQGRGNEAEAIELLKDQISDCKRYELYDLLVSALVIKMNTDALTHGQRVFNQIYNQLKQAEKSRDAVYRALEWNTRFYMVTDRKASQNEQVGVLMEALSELQHLYKETNAALVGQYALTFEMEYHQSMGDYQAASNAGLHLLELIENSPALKSKYRLTSAYFNLAYNEVLMHSFSSALNHINKSLEGAGTGSYNHMVITTLKAQTEYFMGELNLALNTVGNVLESNMIKIAPFESCKMQYIKGCVLFNQQSYLKAYNIFNSENILMDSDPEGWNIGVRLMCILCLVEMQLDDLADMSIESLRKHMSRTNDERHFSTRDKAILKILRSLERNSFDFAITYFKNQELFFKLQSDQSDYCWKIKSHEHIVFHDWFQAKLAGQPYEFAIPEYLPLEINDLSASNNQNTAR
jgi:tetratricopeptide (TPR) repeat protein